MTFRALASIRSLISLLLLAFLAACSGNTSDSSPVLVIDGAQIWDGTGAPAVQDGVLVVRDDRIEAVGPRDSVAIPQGATVVDGKGKTLIPGIINGHGHIGWTRDLVESSTNYTRENVLAQLRQYAHYGVTTVLSLGLDNGAGPVFELRGPPSPDEEPRATVFTAGRGFTGKGGYPGSLPQFPGVPYEVDNKDEIKADIEELASQKVDMVKIWVDDHSGHDKPIRADLYKEIIDQAHAHNLRVMAHVYYLSDAKGLVEAGVDGLAHSIRDREVDDALIQMMKDKGTFLVPTLTREMALLAYSDIPEFVNDPFLTSVAAAGDIEKLKDPTRSAKVRAGEDYPKLGPNLEMAQRNFTKLFDSGVRLVFGTDTGPPGRFSGYFEHLELEMMVGLGLTPAQALHIATMETAESLGIANDFGSLQPGKRADLLLLDGDPLDSIDNTRKISKVWVGGRQVN